MINQGILKEKYNPEGSLLRRHQLCMLEMLKYIDSVCKKNDIKYWLSSGTLLGAVRHKGFIPWDDDCDIEMLRSDYKKLLCCLKKENYANGKYVLQTNENDVFYVMPYAKLRKVDTLVYERGEEDLLYKYRGVFIDIFPLEKSCFFVSRITAMLHNKLLVRIAKSNFPISLKMKIIKISKFFLCKLLYPIIRVLFEPFFKKSCFPHLWSPFYEKTIYI